MKYHQRPEERDRQRQKGAIFSPDHNPWVTAVYQAAPGHKKDGYFIGYLGVLGEGSGKETGNC